MLYFSPLDIFHKMLLLTWSLRVLYRSGSAVHFYNTLCSPVFFSVKKDDTSKLRSF